MQIHQPFCQKDLLRAVERAHVAGRHGGRYSRINLGMAVAEQVGADSHDAHVNELAAVEIPNSATFGPGEIGRPLVRQEHLRPL